MNVHTLESISTYIPINENNKKKPELCDENMCHDKKIYQIDTNI
jgi:hypothetical protein